MRVFKGISYLQTITQNQRRGVSELAKSHGYRMKNTVFPEPKVNYFSLVFYYSLAGFFIYDIIEDRKKHTKVFVEHYEEGKEYMRNLPAFNRFWPMYYPEIDRFLGKPIGVVDHPVEDVPLFKTVGYSEEKLPRKD